MFRNRLLFSILVTGFFVAGCATAAPALTPTAGPAAAAPPAQPTGSMEAGTVNIDIKLFGFKPAEIEVPVGTTVVWTNQDNIGHSITHGSPPDPAGAFDSGFINQGQTFSFTFSEPGDYHYFCRRHNSMTGLVRVVPAAP